MSAIDRPCFALYGDSNTANAYGFTYTERAIAPAPHTSNSATAAGRYPSARLCAAGGAAGAASFPGSQIAALAEGCNVLFYMMGTNNLAQDYASVLKPLIEADIAAFRRRGIEFVIGCPAPPASDSTDGWATAANQTPSPGAVVTRLALNNGWRAGEFDTDAVCDAITAVEVNTSNILTINAGLWRPTYGDNVHFMDAGDAAAAPVAASTIARMLAGDRDFLEQATTLGT